MSQICFLNIKLPGTSLYRTLHQVSIKEGFQCIHVSTLEKISRYLSHFFPTPFLVITADSSDIPMKFPQEQVKQVKEIGRAEFGKVCHLSL